jgi:hypothetical protein
LLRIENVKILDSRCHGKRKENKLTVPHGNGELEIYLYEVYPREYRERRTKERKNKDN